MSDDIGMPQWQSKAASPVARIPEPDVRPIKYAVSCLPLDSRSAHLFTIWVEWRGRDLWAVTDGSFCFDEDGEADWEPIPSEREDTWLSRHRFDLETALALAKRLAPQVVVNGHVSVADALARMGGESGVQ